MPHLTSPYKPFRDQLRHILRRAAQGLTWMQLPPCEEDWLELPLPPASEQESVSALATFQRYALSYFLRECIDLSQHLSCTPSSPPSHNVFEYVVQLLSEVTAVAPRSPWRCCSRTEDSFRMSCGHQGVTVKSPTEAGFVCHQCSSHASDFMGCRHDPLIRMGTKHTIIGCTQCPTFHFHHCHFMTYIDRNHQEQNAILMFENMPRCVFCMFPK